MEENANAILTLCSHLCVGEGVVPLEPREWSELARRLLDAKRTPAELFSFTKEDLQSVLNYDDSASERILRLIDRSASLSFELESYRSMGIGTVTRADTDVYPPLLRKKLGNGCPPIFYCAGELSLLKNRFIGYVGSRTVSAEDVEFTKNAVRSTVGRGFGVVSGGAKGVDTVAGTEALLSGSFAVEYLADSMLKKLRSGETVRNVQDGRLLLMTPVNPDAGFAVGTAMMRNRYIYAQSEATVVVRADHGKGGTWTGAADNLKHGWCRTLCWDHDHPGNRALIELGAAAIPDDWDGILPPEEEKTEADFTQTSLFD